MTNRIAPASLPLLAALLLSMGAVLASEKSSWRFDFEWTNVVAVQAGVAQGVFRAGIAIAPYQGAREEDRGNAFN